MADLDMTLSGLIKVEVAYALPHVQRILTLQLPQGTTVREVIRQSQAQLQLSGTDQTNMAVGIFGKIVPASRVLKDGDRVEIYRPLIADPKQARRQRAEYARQSAEVKAR